MTEISTRYNIGDVAFGVRLQTAQRRPPCPLCEKTGRVRLAAADRYAVCPDCHGRLYDQDDAHMAEQLRASMYRLTIREVRWSSRDGAAYMAEETGVGSGTVWDEEKLYPDVTSALAACAEAEVVFAWIGEQQSVARGVPDWEPFQ